MKPKPSCAEWILMMIDASRAQIDPSISPELSVTLIWLLG
jgi:hypothetical protein